MEHGWLDGWNEWQDPEGYEDRDLELEIIEDAIEKAAEMLEGYAALAGNGDEPPLYRVPGEHRLPYEFGLGEYLFEVSLQVQRATEPGCLALSVQIARNGKGVLAYEGGGFGCHHEHYAAMGRFARELGGNIRRVDWVNGAFIVEVYVLKLAKSDCAKG